MNSNLKEAILEVIKQAKIVSPTSDSCPIKPALKKLEMVANSMDYKAFYGLIKQNELTELANEILHMLDT